MTKKLSLLVPLLFLVAVCSAVAAEPSAYGAGDLDSKNPYGLTSAEKKILENSKEVAELKDSSFELKLKTKELKEEIDGLKSIVIGNSSNSSKVANDIQSLKESLKESNDTAAAVKNLQQKVEENFKLQNQNYDKIMAVFAQLGRIIDDINQNYVSKSDLKAVLGKGYKENSAAKRPVQPHVQLDINDSNKSATVPTVPPAKTSADMPPAPPSSSGEINETEVIKPPESSVGKPAANVQNEPKKLQKDSAANEQSFKATIEKYKKSDYTGAKEAFNKLISEGYKKAECFFYIAEIAYRAGDYETALKHYSQSISLDDKAEYVPVLFFHTGVSLENSSKKQEAKKIFTVLIQNYPGHYLVDSAKRHLAKIK